VWAGWAASVDRGRGGSSPVRVRETTFADVAGIEDVKTEVTETVDFLRNPDRYRRLGAQIPRGVLLSGPRAPGKRCWPEPWR
jgi:ATP-dependent Zn protease